MNPVDGAWFYIREHLHALSQDVEPKAVDEVSICEALVTNEQLAYQPLGAAASGPLEHLTRDMVIPHLSLTYTLPSSPGQLPQIRYTWPC